METRQIEWGDKDRTEVIKEPVPIVRERTTAKCACGGRIQFYRIGEQYRHCSNCGKQKEWEQYTIQKKD